ncbi:MAG: DUF433 domain-containing protein [Archaeoglobaceae archaeon]
MIDMDAVERKVRISRDELMSGAARIAGTRIRVMDVVEKYVVLSYSPEEIAKAFDISLAEVHEALSYYYENPEEIRDDLRKHEEFVEKFRKSLT